jgi:hypothetical protein
MTSNNGEMSPRGTAIARYKARANTERARCSRRHTSGEIEI